MQVAVESISGLERRLKVTVPADQVDQEVLTRLKQQTSKVKLKGFRPGKAPLEVVKMQYGDSIRQEVVNDLIRSTFYEAVTQEHLNPAGLPRIEPKQIKPGLPLEYEAVFEIYPVIEFHDIQGAVIEKLQAQISDADLDKVLQKLREQHVAWTEVTRPAQLGDRVVIDFEGTLAGVPFEGGSAKHVALVLGDNKMIPGFEEGLIGVKPNDTLDLNLTFPEQYPHQELAGKLTQFKVTVHQVMEPKLPELDDKFAEQLNVKGGIEELRSEVRKSMNKELERNTKENLKRQVLKELLKRNSIEVPATLVAAEIGQMQQQIKQRLGIREGQKAPELPQEHFKEQATERVTLGLLLADYINSQQLKVDSARVRSLVEEIASSYDDSAQVINYYYQNKSVLAQIESLVLEELAIEKLLESAAISEKLVSYEEVVNPKS